MYNVSDGISLTLFDKESNKNHLDYESNDSIRSDGFSFEVFMQNKTGLAFYKN